MTSLQTVPPIRHNTTSGTKKVAYIFNLYDRLAAPSLLSSPDSTTLISSVCLYHTEGNCAFAITTPRCQHHIPS
jgi:hypothetical protein